MANYAGFFQVNHLLTPGALKCLIRREVCALQAILWGTVAAHVAIGSGESMAHILEFRSSVIRAEPECEPAREGGAQIIIFPGVRRERHAEQPAKPRRRERVRPKRDRLELPD